MNPVIRRRLPPSVRRLLTDIGPKEQWTDPEPEGATRDGIVLPSRGADSGPEEFLVPAEGGSDAGAEAACMLCESRASRYTCPRCNLRYCGVACYQSPDHRVCSEAFYRQSVLEELKDMGRTEGEQREKMQRILLGLRQKAERTDGGMEALLKEAGILPDDSEEGEEAAEKVQAVELLSRLAQLQQSGGGGAPEAEDILRKLAEIGDGVEEEEAESAEGGRDLAEGLSGMDLDKLSEEELWEILSTKEKEMFMDMMKSGAVGKLVPLWRPWWEEHRGGGRALVEEVSQLVLDQVVGNKVEASQEAKKVKQRRAEESAPAVPPLSKKIPKLSLLCARPSPLVCYGLANALYGYAFSLRFFNGDTDSLRSEFCDMVLALSEALSSNRVFSSLQEAFGCVDALIPGGGYLDREDPLAPTRAVEAVAHIMTGRDGTDATGYCLAALSQLRSALSQARTVLSKDGEEGGRRHQYLLASKKCEFFQAWVLDNAAQIQHLATESWNEHSKRQRARSSLQRDRAVVEENLKKVKKRGKRELIEELS